MSCRTLVYQWQSFLRPHLPHLSQPQLSGLALWSVGVVLARSCSLSLVSLLLAHGLDRAENTLRQRLREWYCEAPRKRGAQRREIEVESCFPLLLSWLLQLMAGQQLALALDATSLGDRFVVLCISVLYRGTAIPVAWQVLPANVPGRWRPHWLRLLRRLRPAVPDHYCVLVLADRGLYGRWLFRRIVRLGWHPCLRINSGGTFRLQGQRHYQSLSTLVQHLPDGGSVAGEAFQGARRLACTLGVHWEKGCGEPWLVLTDLPPEAYQACWYGLRAWIEHGFKFTKREGWQWQRTQMVDAERAQRMWLVLAVATLWLVTVGSEAEDKAEPLAPATAPPTPSTPHTPKRRVSVFRRGWAALLSSLLFKQRLPWGRLRPQPWPVLPPATMLYHDTS